MPAKEYKTGRLFVGRLSYNDDIVEATQKFCLDNNITMGLFSAIGAVKNAAFSYYDQLSKTYRDLTTGEPCEIVSCIGNISTREGKPFLHAHIAVSGDGGNTLAGHLIVGTTVFSCEFTIREILGPELTRNPDATTGLWLWPIE